MGIPILSEIEKLINERGSAKILQERISLAKEQYEALEKELSASKARETKFETENLRFKLDNEQLKTKIGELKDQIDEMNLLTLKYGVYWDKDGNVYCPKCKTPGLTVMWTTYVRQQVLGLKCTCSDSPFILIDNGEPIHAQEAMKIMAQKK
jgi:hypothetical protein